MEIGLCWYQKGTKNKWTYNVTDHLMVYIEKIITSTYKVEGAKTNTLKSCIISTY
jgi:hypothetical protein